MLKFRIVRLVWLRSKFFIGGVSIHGVYDAIQCTFNNVGITNFNEPYTTRITFKFWDVGLKSLLASGKCLFTIRLARRRPTFWHPGLLGLILKAASATRSIFGRLPQGIAPPSNWLV